MTTVLGVGLYVMGDKVKHEDGREWKFSNHGCAYCAMMRLNKPLYCPLGGQWGAGDLEQFERMRAELAQ